MNLLKLFIICILFTFASSQAVKLPVGFIPGLGDSCMNPISMARVIKMISKEVPNQLFCIDSGPSVESILTSFDSQVDRACSIIKKKSSSIDFSNGFILVGLSQGGLVGRAAIEKCEMGDKVKKLITLGGPHQGVAQFPHTGKSFFDNILNKIADWAVYTAVIQHHVGPAGYFHRIDHEETYKNSNILLADVNNVKTVNEDYKKRIQGLEALVMIMFSKDTMIIPKETAHFGFYKDKTRTDIVALEDSEIVSKDLLGIKKLIDEKKVFKHEINGDHLQFGMDDLREFVFPYF